MAEVVPLDLKAPNALKIIKQIAADSGNIIILKHALNRQKQREITRIEVERCLREGWISEGPYRAVKTGNWRINITRRAAGDEITCTVEIEWATRLLVVTVFQEV